MRRPTPRLLAATALTVALAVFAGGERGASAGAGDIGYEGFAYTGTSTPTGAKRAESVLWWNDGSWSASMWDPVSQDFHIFRLDVASQTWKDTGVTIDQRANTRADVLWDGTHLYVASHLFVSDETAAASGYPSYLYRFSYDAATKKYALDSGFPVTINNYKTETLVIDKDSTGKLWATWQQGNKIYVNRTLGDDASWGTPFVLPVTGSSVTVDDNSSVIAFGGNKIGVMWSNQTSGNDAMFFAVHEDGQPDSTWQASRTALQGSGSADDHINLKSLQSDSSGRVLAAVKTSFNAESAPLIMLLVRDPGTGDWASHPIARVSECPNRPIVVIDEENRVLHAIYTAPAPPGYACQSGGAIYEKTSPLDAISFPTGYGTPVMLDADSDALHDVSSTKQNVNSTTDLVALAVNSSTRRYWHAHLSISPASPPPPPTLPTAEFAATPTAGPAPLAVRFADGSSGSPSSWSWSFGDGGTSTQQSPTHTYASPGTYTISLTVANAIGSDSETKIDYVTVNPPAPDFSLAVSPASRSVVRGSGTSYTVTISPANGFSGSVALSVTGLPAGVTGSFSVNPVSVPATTSSTLVVATSSTAKQGSYTLTVIATSGGLNRTASVSLQIKRR